MDPIACGLPHREPFVFLDEVESLVPGESAVCSKVFKPEEPFFRGHFPGDPLVPGVILTEALAQASGIAAGTPGAAVSFHLSAIKQMKFLRPVRPLEKIFFHAQKLGCMGGLHQFRVKAEIAGEIVAEGAVVLSET